MSVYRVNKTRDFTVMGNTHLRDKNLSLKAVGLLSKMLSFNDGWQFSTRGLAALCKEGPDAILSALRELEKHGYDEVFHHVITRGPHKGEVRGFAWAGMCAVNRDCKIPPVRKYNAALFPDTVSYVGIAEDEPKRLARLDGVTKVSLLAKYGMTEADAYKFCQDHGLLSPIYAHCRRNGCWFCPNASDEELLHMITKHPELFDRLIEWEKEDNIFHRRLTRRETPSEVKARLLSKSQTGFSSPRSK